jgi:hypothetical protein
VENGIVSGYQVLERERGRHELLVASHRTLKLALGALRRWPPRTADFSPPRASGRRRLWESRKWPCRRQGVCRRAAQSGRKTSPTLARRLRGHHQPFEKFVLDAASQL